jgi:hypothetical protein
MRAAARAVTRVAVAQSLPRSTPLVVAPTRGMAKAILFGVCFPVFLCPTSLRR